VIVRRGHAPWFGRREHSKTAARTDDSQRLLIIDEIHRLLACTSRDQRAALNTLKRLSNEFRVSIVAPRTNEALHVMRTNPQIASRFDHVVLSPWTASEEFRSFVAEFGEQLGVNVAAIANDVVAIEYLLDVSGGVTGRIVEMIRLAGRNAFVRNRRKLALEELQGRGGRSSGTSIRCESH